MSQIPRPSSHRRTFSGIVFAAALAAIATLTLAAAPLPAPVPDANAQAVTQKSFHERYQDELARKSPDGRAEFLRKLVTEAKPEEKPAEYVLLRNTLDLAAELGNAPIALKALDTLDDEFAVDIVQVRLEVLPALARSSANSPKDSTLVAGMALAQIEASLARGDDKTAEALLPVAGAAAERGGNDAAAMRQMLKKLSDQRSVSSRLKTLTAKLAANSKDPAINLDAGKVLCFERGDFDAGLPMLERGSDAALAELAKRDLAAGDVPIVRIALGHDWWDIADAAKGHGKVFAQQRAATFYRSALASLEGTRKTAIERRIAEADQALKASQQVDGATAFDAKAIEGARAAIDAAPTEAMPAEALNGDKTINPAAGDKAFALQGPITVPEGVNVTLTIAAGTEIRGGEFQMGRTGHIVVPGTRDKPVIFRNVIFQHDLGGSFEGEWVVFENCQFHKQCCWFEHHSSKWRFTNCVLFNCKFGGLTGVDYGFQIRHCALVSMNLPEIAHDRSAGDFDHMKHLRTEWNLIQNCDFIDCTLPPTVAWCAERCNFIACGFTPGEAFRSAEPLKTALYTSQTRSRDPQIVSDESTPPGNRVRFEAAEHAFDGAPLSVHVSIPEIRLNAAGLVVSCPITPLQQPSPKSRE